MPKKRLVVTSRGLKLDMDALKASQPNARPLVINKDKDKPAVKAAPKPVTLPRQPRIYATTPAPLPKPTDIMPKQVVPASVPPVEIKTAASKVTHVGQKVVEEVETYADEPTIHKGKNKKE